MSVRTRFKGWRRKRRRKKAAKALDAPLREFVYLDDVSVYSLIASRLGPIATEFTDTETKSLRGEIASSLGGHVGVAKGEVTSRSEGALTEDSQVLRKSIVQTTFKELVELEADRLKLRTMEDHAVPKVNRVDALQGAPLSSSVYEGWLIDPATLTRGQMIEVDVELEADSTFRVNAVMTAIIEMMQENLELFGVENVAQLSQARSLNRVIEKLLTGLVPLRGHSVDYEVIELQQHEWLIHRSLLEQLPSHYRDNSRPLVVVGVADRSLFWKDIRRVLFSNSRFTMLCRMGESGVRSDWTPVKLVDVLGGIAPELGSQVGMLGEGALLAMGDAVAHRTQAEDRKEAQFYAALLAFASMLTEHHGRDLDDQALRAIASSAVADTEAAEIDSLTDRRLVFREVASEVDKTLGVHTSAEAAARFRVAAMADAGFGLGGPSEAASSEVAFDAPSATQERFLDTEIVAIYW